ncbi:efflux RND transporter periplasmic adaptor subunit [Pseudobythopirellula maris]|uniref:efflux RND transporter periplasmic adaptor subunit n=1 Tax=Pseudobythopirellula maris TaxID=2527991 RepID=UPI0018D307F4|nr:efflux RND transporter periplasmic adaptor subunit [Pseudobythopirellula maris]
MTFLAAGSGCAKNEYAPPPPPEVTVATPVEKTLRRTLSFTGTTSPIERVEIRARVSGFVDRADFVDGSDVKAGDLLYVIDPRPFEAKVRQAEASQQLAEARLESANAEVVRARSEANNAEAQLARGERAAQGGAVTEGELDDLRTARDAAFAAGHAAQAMVASAEAEIAAAKAQVEQTRLDLGYTQVVTPIDGRVGESLVDVGNLVGTSEPTHLTTVVRYDPIYAYFTISEAQLLKWIGDKQAGDAVDNPARQATGNFPLQLSLGNEEGYPHDGVLDYADLSVDQSSGTFLVRGRFENPERTIPPGAFVRIRAELEEKPAMLVDERAVGRDQGGAYVLVVVEQDGKQVVDRRNVTLGESHEGMQVIETGLQPSERVVVNGLQRARPGAVVRPRVAAAQTAAGAPGDQTPGDPMPGDPAAGEHEAGEQDAGESAPQPAAQ